MFSRKRLALTPTKAAASVRRGTLKVTLKASPNAMEHWAMQYVNYVEVVSPKALRDRVRNNVLAGVEKYR